MNIKFYGTKYCPDCIRTKAYFDENSIIYDDIDLDAHPESIKTVCELNKGKIITPTIVITFDNNSQKILLEPTNEDLSNTLNSVIK